MYVAQLPKDAQKIIEWAVRRRLQDVSVFRDDALIEFDVIRAMDGKVEDLAYLFEGEV